MRKPLTLLLFLTLIFFTSSSYAGKVLEGEAPFASLLSGKLYVDYIVSTTALDGGLPAGLFVFSTLNGGPGLEGTKALYDASSYYYYYQLENNSPACLTTIHQLTLNVDSDSILSAGYILLSDIDDAATFNHNLAGEHENVVIDRPPDESDYDTISFPQNQTWSFSPELAIGGESTVLFITSSEPPVFSPAYALDGTPFSGVLPVPEMSDPPSIPEPFSIILMVSAVLGLFVKNIDNKRER